MTVPGHDIPGAAGSSTFVVAGESLVDIVVPADGSGRHDAVGGSCLNVAVGLARLDVPTTLATRVGDDELGRLVLQHVEDSRVALAAGSVVPGGVTSTATAHLDAHHAATYDFEIEWDLATPSLPTGTLGLHVGSLGTTLEPGRTAVAHLVREAADADVFVSYDPNVRPFFLTDRDAAWRDVREMGSGARLVKLSDEDLRLLRPDDTEDDVCHALLGGRTELVVLTRGAAGATAFTEGSSVDVPAPPTDVVDTVGAGDSFMAAMLALLWDWDVVRGGEGTLAALDDARVELLVRGAVAAAAVTCSRRGANPPTRRELPPTWPAG
ncbi:MAG: fructokinase [Nocardioidaceae bacterium]|jgi:fructokinase|nr:fructokinase [Nocardioidaceae bacterium]